MYSQFSLWSFNLFHFLRRDCKSQVILYINTRHFSVRRRGEGDSGNGGGGERGKGVVEGKRGRVNVWEAYDTSKNMKTNM